MSATLGFDNSIRIGEFSMWEELASAAPVMPAQPNMRDVREFTEATVVQTAAKYMVDSYNRMLEVRAGNGKDADSFVEYLPKVITDMITDSSWNATSGDVLVDAGREVSRRFWADTMRVYTNAQRNNAL